MALKRSCPNRCRVKFPAGIIAIFSERGERIAPSRRMGIYLPGEAGVAISMVDNGAAANTSEGAPDGGSALWLMAPKLLGSPGAELICADP